MYKYLLRRCDTKRNLLLYNVLKMTVKLFLTKNEKEDTTTTKCCSWNWRHMLCCFGASNKRTENHLDFYLSARQIVFFWVVITFGKTKFNLICIFTLFKWSEKGYNRSAVIFPLTFIVVLLFRLELISLTLHQLNYTCCNHRSSSRQKIK